MSSSLTSIILGAGIPVVVNAATFFVVRRIAGEDPSKLMKANVVGFLLRFVLYGIAIITVARFIGLSPVWFIVSFAGVFILLLVAEGLYFNRLFLRHNSSE